MRLSFVVTLIIFQFSHPIFAQGKRWPVKRLTYWAGISIEKNFADLKSVE